MKNFDETRRALVYAGWMRRDRTSKGRHIEGWVQSDKIGRITFSYEGACQAVGIEPLPFVERTDPRKSYPRKKPLQAKHISIKPILQAVAAVQKEFYEGTDTQKSWATIWDLERHLPALKKLPQRLVQAKMNGLIRKGYLDGCSCGCRGDYEMTDKGHAFLDRTAS